MICSVSLALNLSLIFLRYELLIGAQVPYCSKFAYVAAFFLVFFCVGGSGIFALFKEWFEPVIEHFLIFFY